MLSIGTEWKQATNQHFYILKKEYIEVFTLLQLKVQFIATWNEKYLQQKRISYQKANLKQTVIAIK